MDRQNYFNAAICPPVQYLLNWWVWLNPQVTCGCSLTLKELKWVWFSANNSHPQVNYQLLFTHPKRNVKKKIGSPLLVQDSNNNNKEKLHEMYHHYSQPGVHNAKAEECTTPYMRQNIKINIGVGGLHGNQGY